MCSCERGAGFEPATDGLQVRCSTQLSYPVVGVQVSNLTLRVAPALSPGELPPASSWPHSCVLPAYATAAPRAPAGIKIRAAGNIRQYVPDYPRRSADNVVRPIQLIGRVNDGFPPRATRAGASPRGAHAPVAAAPLPQGVRQHALDAPGQNLSVPDRKAMLVGCARSHAKAFANAWKEKTPGFSRPEGIRSASGDRRWPISRGVDRRQRLSALCAPRAASSARRPATRSSCVMRMIWWRGWKFMSLDWLD